jgi:hypothetical protein
MKRQQEMEQLYELSRNLLLLDQQSPAASQVAYRILQVFELPGVAVFDREEDKVYRAGATDTAVTDGRLRDTALQGTVFHDPKTGLSVLPLKLGRSLEVWPSSLPVPAVRCRTRRCMRLRILPRSRLKRHAPKAQRAASKRRVRTK